MTDFEKFHISRCQYGKAALDHVKSRMPVDYMSPTILEEREMHVTQMDVFSRLMMDRQLFLGDAIDSHVANVVVSQLLYLDSNSNEDITIYLNSPGGSVYDGLGIIDTMGFIKSKVRVICTGLAASMGSVILACGTKGMREALPHARVMIHQPMSGTGSHAQASDIEIVARETNILKQELCGILASRSGQSIEKVIQDCDRDHWLTAQESLEYGFIDRVIPVQFD